MIYYSQAMNIKSVLMIYLFGEWEIVISTYDWDLFIVRTKK